MTSASLTVQAHVHVLEVVFTTMGFLAFSAEHSAESNSTQKESGVPHGGRGVPRS